MSGKKISKNITLISARVLMISLTLGLLSSSHSPAQPVCVPYVPVIINGTANGVIGAGVDPHCQTQTIIVNFGVLLAGEPLVSIRHWELQFTNTDHPFGLGIVEIVSNPAVGGGGNAVGFDVRVCLKDADLGDPVSFQYTYTVAAWPQL